MDDILLIDYLKKKGVLNDTEYTNIITGNNKAVQNDSHYDMYSTFFDSFKEVTKNMGPSEKGQFVERLKDFDNRSSEHFNESYAKYIVSKMWHRDDFGRKISGEKYDMTMAKEICERYRGVISSTVTYSDIYVAINSHYHDMFCLYNKWFNGDTDHKIIESAIIYWFKDDDYDSMDKLWYRFKNE